MLIEIIVIVNIKTSFDDELNASLFNCFSVCLYFMYEKSKTIAPTATNKMPIMEEYPCCEERVAVFPSKIEICLMNKENFTTTKPKAIIPILVLIHAKSVRSFAKCSLAFCCLISSLTKALFSSFMSSISNSIMLATF